MNILNGLSMIMEYIYSHNSLKNLYFKQIKVLKINPAPLVYSYINSIKKNLKNIFSFLLKFSYIQCEKRLNMTLKNSFIKII